MDVFALSIRMPNPSCHQLLFTAHAVNVADVVL